MKTKGLDKIIVFEPENTWDAFQLGRFYEKSRQELKPGVSLSADKAITNALLGIRFDAAELVKYLLIKGSAAE